MSLFAIVPDPKPTAEELQAILDRPGFRDRTSQRPAPDHAEVTRGLARMTWRAELRAEDPNAFLVPFSTDPEAFGHDGHKYEDYRRGDVWAAQRGRVMDRACGLCAGCGRRATEVHHRDYRPRVIAGEDDTPLVALCRKCHGHVHAKARGIEPSWQESEARLARLVAAHEASAARPLA